MGSLATASVPRNAGAEQFTPSGSVSPRRRALVAAAAVVAAAALAQATAWGQGQTITFSAIGDVPYGADEVAVLQAHVANHNLYSPSEFLVHVGDIKNGGDSCDEFWYQSAASALRGLAVPAYIVPGDNEYVDCADPGQAWSFWVTHLLALEQNFCGIPVVDHQPQRTENFAFVKSGVLFVGINKMHGLPNTAYQLDATWVQQQLQDHGSQVRAAVVFAQNSPTGNSVFSTPFRAAAATFGKPVLYIHGDGHSWVVDHPYPEANVLRVQVERGDDQNPPVRVTVNMDPTEPFLFEQDPWPNGTPLYNRAPCVDAGSDTTIVLGDGLPLHGEVTDNGVPIPSTLTATWTKVSGPGNAFFDDPSALATTVYFTLDGNYVLRLSVSDGQLVGSDTLVVQVQDGSNQPPLVTVTAPASGSSVSEEDVVTFSGTAVDPEDGNLTSVLTWSSNLDGPIGTGSPVSTSSLTVGIHTITALATDSDGANGAQSILLTVLPSSNGPPSVSITLPASGTGFNLGQAVTFTGTATDLEDGPLTSALSWSSNRDGAIGSGGSFTTSTLSQGFHTITASVTDSNGASGSAQILITVGVQTLEVRVATSSDDAEEAVSGGAVNISSSDLEMVLDGSTQQTVGMRFNGVTIPRGALINQAWIQFSAAATSTVATTLTIQGQDADNAPTFTTAASSISTRARTSASVSWTPPSWTAAGAAGAAERSPDLSPVLQQIVNRVGWSSGNSLAIIVTGSGKRNAESYNGTPIDAPLLHLAYSTGNSPPTISDIGNQTTPQDTPTGAIGFTVGDATTPPGSLTLSRSSSDPTLVPVANIVFGGSGANRTVTVTPVAGQVGAVTLTVTVSDGTASTSDSFLLTVTPPNEPPTISDIADRSTPEDTATGAIGFVVGDFETAAGSLSVSGSSSNPSLVPAGNIVFGGSGANRTVTVTPAANQSGSATVTVTVSDGSATASDSFVLGVTAVNDPPTISDVTDRSTMENTPTGAIAFTVSDPETAAGSLSVSASSSDVSLVPSGNIVFGGSGASRTVTVTPAAGQIGSATVTLEVSDGTATGGDSFVLSVIPYNDPPTISDIADRSTAEDGGTGAISFTVGDAETAPGDLAVSGSSSNPALVPAGNIVFGGSGASRAVTVTPAANQSGTATITVTVSDGTGSASDGFVLTVTAVNDPPTISDIADRSTAEDTGTGAIGFTVGDVETAAASLTVGGSSSNPGLVPPGNIVFGGSGASRTVTVTPAANQSGTATITITVGDGTATASDGFVLTVTAVNDPPVVTITAPAGGSSFGLNNPVTFGGTATDVEDGTLTASLSWVSSRDGTIGTGGSFSTSTLSAGAHTITASVGDGGGASGSAQIGIQIGSQTLDVRVAANADDAEESNTGSVSTSSSDLEMVLDGSTQQTVGMRFNGIVIAPGAVITEAWIQFTAAGTSSVATTLAVQGQNADNAPTFTSTASSISTRPRTAASVSWSPAAWTAGTTGAAQKSPDLATVIQEIVNRAGWSSGNSLAIIVTGSGVRNAESYNGAPASAPLLHVAYSTGSNTPPTISDTGDRTTPEDTSTGAIGFTVGDAQTPPGNLTLSGSSSNPAVVPPGNIAFGGSGANRTVTVTPAANQSGAATITITVSDGVGSASDSFELTVTPANDPPIVTITAPAGGSSFGLSSPVTFTATANDVEEGAVTASLSWTSSRDGAIGSGGSFSISTLSQGTHTITASAMDGNGATGSAQVTVHIGLQTLDVRVAANTDDAEESATGTVSTGSSDLEMVLDASIQTVGMRFNGITIPQGASISQAWIQFTAAGTGAVATTLAIQGQDVNNAPTFTTTASSISTRPRTSASVSWSPDPWTSGEAGLAQRTPDLSAVIQQIVSRAGWSSGNSLVIIVTGSGVRNAESYNGSTTAAPLLHVQFGAASNTPPTVSDITDRSTTEDTATGAVAFTVGDAETAPGSLTVSGSSSNPALVPSGNIAFGGSGASRTVTVTPAANQSGTASVTVTVGDGSTTASDSFVLTVTAVNDLPTISDITDRSTAESTPTGAIAFTVGDVETAAGSLTVSASSSDGTLVPPGNIAFGGSGASRTVTITPAAGQVGSATITVEVSDGAATASDSFVLTVTPTNDPPTVSDIADRSVAEDGGTGAIAFTVGDAETAPGDLVVSGSSSNPALVPAGNIVFGGSGANRTVTVTPAANQSGTATITVTVSDGIGSANDGFVLTVTAENDPPTISDIADRSTAEDTGTGAIGFTVGDVETAAASLTVSGSSSNPGLVAPGSIVFGGSGASRTVTVTPAANQSGTATITVTVGDGTATASDGFVLTVTAVNDPPVVTITAPAGGSSFGLNDPVTFGGTATDVEDGTLTASLSWTSSRDGAIGTGGSFSTSTLSAGAHTITASVGDGGGAPGSAQIGIQIGSQALEVRVAAGADDAEESTSGSVSAGSSDLEMVLDGSTQQTVGMRFNGISIPQGAVVTNAWIQFTSAGSSSVATTLAIQGQTADSAPTFTSAAFSISTRPRTAASVSWSPAAWTASGLAGAAQQTPNLAPVIQEIVNRAGWSSGNSLVIIVTGSGKRNARAYSSGSPGAAALLHLEW